MKQASTLPDPKTRPFAVIDAFAAADGAGLQHGRALAVPLLFGYATR
jgi:hypothetical protein